MHMEYVHNIKFKIEYLMLVMVVLIYMEIQNHLHLLYNVNIKQVIMSHQQRYVNFLVHYLNNLMGVLVYLLQIQLIVIEHIMMLKTVNIRFI
jgi:hypothetical protein